MKSLIKLEKISDLNAHYKSYYWSLCNINCAYNLHPLYSSFQESVMAALSDDIVY